MSQKDQVYHREREQHCRSMAEHALDPDIRRRHQELAELHASLAAQSAGLGHMERELSAI